MVFNTKVTFEEYEKIKIPEIPNEIFSDFWKEASIEEKQEYYDIPNFSQKVFEEITGI